MTAAEAQWRGGTLVRNGLDRLGSMLRTPTWHRRELASLLVTTPDTAPVAAAVQDGRWRDAHVLLAQLLATGRPSFVVGPALRDAVRTRVIAAYPDAARDAAQRADRVLSGEYDLLGYRALRFDPSHGQAEGQPTGDAPDWHLDPVHARRAPRTFWSQVPYLDPSVGDHKIVWELNRQQHLLLLARASWLTGEGRYRTQAVSQIRGWMDANPPLVGINWASMLELAFRSISWTWTAHLLADPEARDTEPWLVDLLIGLDRQLDHIEQNLSHYFSPNTHLLGEALALFVAGHAFPMLRRSGRRIRTGRRILVEQVARQIGADGGHLERSTHYHRYTLDFYVLALSVARLASDEATPAFESAVTRLAAAARLLADGRGRLPHIGDDDGGTLLPMCGRAADDVRDSLAIAAALVDRPDLRIGDTPEEAFWMLAHPALHARLAESHAVRPSAIVGSAVLPDMGYYVSRSLAGDHLVIDAGAHGFANGGHAHADALSLTLSVRGLPLLIDPGTGSYTADASVRDRFRSSLLHNTLVIDGRSQSTPSGPFHWHRTAHGTAHVWRANAGFDYLEASHDGYAPLEHRRHVLAVHGDLVIVADLVQGEGEHEIQVHWHLDPRWTVEAGGRRVVLRAPGERVAFAVSGGSIEHVEGGSEPAVGWHAPVYGRIEPTSALRVRAAGPTPIWVVSVIGLNPVNDLLSVEPVPVWSQAGVLTHALAVRIARAHSVDIFGIAAPRARAAHADAPERRWRLGSFETDARMLFVRTADAVSRVAMVDGSFVRATDRHALHVRLPHEAPDLHLDLAHPRGSQPVAARVSGAAYGAFVQCGGRDLPVAVERRATARASARRQPPTSSDQMVH